MATTTKKANNTRTRKAATTQPINVQEIDALLIQEEVTPSTVLLTNGEDLIVGDIIPNSKGLTMYVAVLNRDTRAYAITFPSGVTCPFSPTDIIDAGTLVVRHGDMGLASYVTHSNEVKKGIEGRLNRKGETFGTLTFLMKGEEGANDALNQQRRMNRAALNTGEMTTVEYMTAQQEAAQRFASLL